MKFSNVHHIAIICANYERSKYFYSTLLGFEIIKETYREARQSFKLDLRINENTQMELFSFPQAPTRPTNPEACGLRHLAFAVTDLEQTIEYLNTHGVATEAIRLDEITQKRFTFFRDPDDLPLELYES